jgi:integrase/recombinase XerD
VTDPAAERGAPVAKAFTDEQARTMFVTLILTGLRRFEVLALRWHDLSLVEGVLHVRESKSEDGERSIALSPALVTLLETHYRQTLFKGMDELVFRHPTLGTAIHPNWFAEQFREALKLAGTSDYVRPFHDLRHSSLTNGAAAGEAPIALMARAGHASMKTTQAYVDLAGVLFRDEAERLERRLLGVSESSTEASTRLA